MTPAIPPVSILDPYDGTEILPLYTTTVTLTGGAAGHGRASGHARSDDGALDIALGMPPELGGEGKGTNPEQLFAAGYAACFHGALRLVSIKRGVDLPHDFAIYCTVSFARDPVDGRFCITADLEVSLPGLDQDRAKELIEETELMCPYSKMVYLGISSSTRLR
ncbi:Ohr family peroxiredoxin [Bordetella petrii]|nr:Ohr family peroxiredoxin [Bordetella petrii]